MTSILEPQVFKPLPTWFDGILFRSKTEARWAVFLKALGVVYQYEAEGYDIDGTWYLPDFYIPEWNYFIEIKSYGLPQAREFRLAEGLQELSGLKTFIFGGIPGLNSYQVWFPVAPDLYPVKLGDCRRCPTGIWFFNSECWGHFAGCEEGCSSEKHPGSDFEGRVGRAMSEAASFRFPTASERGSR